MRKRALGLEWRAGLLAGALVAASSAAVGYWTYSVSNDELVRREEFELVDDAALSMLSLKERLDELRADALYLAGTEPALGIARAVGAGGVDPVDQSSLAEWKRRLETLFVQMLRTHPDYFQVRFIGANDDGLEIVRAERYGGKERLVRGEDLQHKGGRDYVRRAMSLRTGSVFLSEFELNREYGEIQVPHRPVVRSATPVPGPDGEAFGVIVINLDLASSFATLHGRKTARRLYVLNERGDFLVHPDPAKAFRFELGEPFRLGDEFPTLVSAFDSDLERATSVDEREPEDWTLGLVRQDFDPLNPRRRLTVVIAEPRAQVIAGSTQARNRATAVGLVLILATIGISAWLTRRVTRQIGGEPDEIELITRRVASGDLDIPFDESPDEAVGIFGSVRRMVDALRAARAASERGDWLKTELSRTLEEAQRAASLADLASAVIARLARATDSAQGVFHLARTAEGRAPELHPIGSFARESGPGEAVRFGEGLAGQCALDRELHVLDDLPPEVARIHSGLVSGRPINLILVPVCLETQVVAVLELASWSRYGEAHRELFERVCPSLAVAIEARMGRERTEQLLVETQELSARSQAQAEELRVANEELEEKGRALAQQTEELESQTEELRVANEELSEKGQALERQTVQLRDANGSLEEMRASLERKALELERASSYKSAFLTNVSHELRTPLNSMLLLARSLCENRSGNLTSEQVEELGVIERSGRDLLRLINGILDLSRIEAGRVDLAIRPVPFEPLLDALRAQFAPLAEERGVVFEVVAEADLPASLETDEQRLAQVLRNLLGNALKFTSEGSVALRVFRAAAPDDRIGFEVRDTGVGIPQDRQAAVFESFTQVGEVQGTYGGSGLGLAISRQLAALLGGEIQLVSEAGVGSSFTLLVPERFAAPSAPAKPQPVLHETSVPLTPVAAERPREERSHRAVLIVEDDAGFAEQLAVIVRERGYEPHLTHDAASALELAPRLRPGAILLDLGLPDLDGAEVLRRLKADPAVRDVPVHVITGRDGSEALESGALQVLAKPVSREAIERILPAGRGPRRVLVADADPDSRESLGAMLGGEAAEIVSVDSAERAVDRLSDEEFDCVIVDQAFCDAKLRELLIRRLEESDGARPGVFVQTSDVISESEERELREFAAALVVKDGGRFRLRDEVSIFLHSVESSLPETQRRVVPMVRDGGSLEGKRVLVVDDDVRNTFALSRALRAKGMEVVLADDGQLALDRLGDSGPFDAVLMDMMMPVMDGYAAIREIRRRPRLANLPVIALTARAMTGDRELCLEAGANDYLTKPLDLERLLSVLRIWLVERV